MATLSVVAQLQYMEESFAESGGKSYNLTWEVGARPAF